MKATEYIDHIEHDGIVLSRDLRQGTVKVRLTDADDCSACPAANLCNIAGNTHNDTITVETLHPQRFMPGTKVRVIGTERMHRRAIMLATVIPCIVMLAVMVLIYVFTANQLAAALGGLGSAIFFFMALYLMREKVRHEFAFTIEKAD